MSVELDEAHAQPDPAASVDRDGLALALDQVVKEYPGGVHALRGVSLVVANTDQLAVLGPSGSGKTTMLTILGTPRTASWPACAPTRSASCSRPSTSRTR